MGNNFSTVSTFDHATQLKEFKDPERPYSWEFAPADPNGEFGPIYRSCHLKPGQDLVDGFYGSKTVRDTECHDVFSSYAYGMNVSGRDAPSLWSRAFKPAPEDAPTKSGYVERKDGTVDRFEYVPYSFGLVHDSAIDFGRGLAALGVPSKSRVAIFAPNRPEWMIFMLGLFSQRNTVVPLYPTLGPESVEYIIMEAQTEALVCSLENLPKMVTVMEKVPTLKSVIKHLIVIDCLFDGLMGNVHDKVPEDKKKEILEKYSIPVYGMSEVLAKGKEQENIEKFPVLERERTDIAVLMYTSGTTGNPKGVILTQNNIVSCMGCVCSVVELPPDTRMFLYLPLMHVFAIVLACIAFGVGGQLYFPQGDVRRLVDDMVACKPHVLPTVPRVFVKMYQTVFQTIDAMPFYKRWYIYNAYNYQLNQLRNGLPLDPSYDSRVLSVFREKLGLTDLRIAVLGGSPTPNSILEFMRVVTNSWIIQGYGLTESSAGSFVTLRHDYLNQHTGGPVSCLDFRLASVPDMEYLYEKGEGELLLSGSTIFQGYYRNPEATAATLVEDSNGRKWLRTGDVARLNPNMGISIIDRKKSLVKNSLGEYLSLEKLMNAYATSPNITQILIYGNSFKASIVAVIAPSAPNLYQLAKEKGWWSIEEVPVTGALTPAVIQEYGRISDKHQQELVDWIKPTLAPCEKGLLSFEKVKAFYVDAHYTDTLGQTFTEANGLLTPTMKIRQQHAVKAYHEKLRELYKQIGEPDDGQTAYW